MSVIKVFEIPSRKRIFNIPLAGLEIVCYEFNKSGSLLAVLCKTGDKIAEFSIKVLDMTTSEIGTATENIKGGKGVPYFTYLDTTIVVTGKIRENNIDGLIYLAPRYCDPYEFDYPIVKGLLQEMRIPHLFLQIDFSSASESQIRTRLEAFAEMLRGEV